MNSKKNNKALIISGYINEQDEVKKRIIPFIDEATEIICADRGWIYAREMGLEPDSYIGDYDSSDRPDGAERIKILKCEKDDTDTEAAVDAAYAHGARDIIIAGGLGGRFDHTMGNIGTLCKYLGKFGSAFIIDGRNKVFLMGPGRITVKKDGYKYLGIAAYGGLAEGVTLKGFKYPLDGFTLGFSTSLGVSNEITGDEGVIELRSGILLITQSND
jgi:thiamine pyrophosphokinase